ncbi:MAG: hypothetical protein R3181_04835 [Rubricoccaceae bacterium]|nr:hypothetical protein [Rubricoccaceae bacterium]
MPLRTLGLLVLLLAASSAGEVTAQPEVVPSEHAVYGFLHGQRVAGRLPLYRHEMRPLDRAAVQRHLDSLRTRADRLDPSARYWLDEFRREFFEPADAIEQVIGPEGLRLPRRADTEKFLYYHRDADWRLALRGTGRLQARWSEAAEAYSGLALVPEGVLEGHYRAHVGFYSATFDGQQFGGDTRVLLADPVLAPLYYVSRDPNNVPGSFDRSTASLRAGVGPFAAEIAHERLVVGPAFGQPLALSDHADYFSFLRLALDTRVVQYQFVHGALGDRAINPLDTGFVLVAPERYLALHRLTLQPHRRVSLAFTEMVVYGQRGPELAYLNPLYPIKPAEHALWDRDNSLFTLDAVVRPLDGVEASGTYLVDDLDFGQVGDAAFGYKWAAQGGLGVALDRFVPGTTGFVEYARIEPYTYTHRFLLDGSFYNAYQHNGFGLGHPLGPNSDEVSTGVDVWLPFRARVRATGRYRRRAEAFVNDEGVLVNAGGDVTDGTPPDDTGPGSKVFLQGERFEGPGASLSFLYEPFRGLAFRLFGDWQRWDGDPDQLFVRAEVGVTL